MPAPAVIVPIEILKQRYASFASAVGESLDSSRRHVEIHSPFFGLESHPDDSFAIAGKNCLKVVAPLLHRVEQRVKKTAYRVETAERLQEPLRSGERQLHVLVMMSYEIRFKQ